MDLSTYLTAILESTKICFDPMMMFLVFLAVIWGNIGGALPGVGPSLTVAVMLPFTFAMTAEQAIACLVAANCACSYGNSIPAILIGVPGTSSAVLTATDGFALHKRGESGLALGVQYYSAVMGQFLSIFFFFAMVVPLAQLTYILLPPEMFAIYFLGVTAVISITGDDIVKGLAAATIGFIVSMVGRDPIATVPRFVYDAEMSNGVEVTAVIMGLLAVSELFRQMRQSFAWGGTTGVKFTAKFPAWKILWGMTPKIFLGCIIGMVVGAIPGIGGTTAAFISYTQAKVLSKHPEEFGHGSIEGIAANEAAQNASQAGEMVPTFGMGIPGSGTMVMLFAAMTMHGFIPGPRLIEEAPQLLYAAGGGIIATTFLLLIIGWPLCRVLFKIVTLDRTSVIVGALGLCMIGIWTINRSMLDIYVMLFFGIVGYFMMRYGYSVAACSIMVILGRGVEGNLRRGLQLTDNDFWIFFTRPWTLTIFIIALGLLIYGAIGTIRLARKASEVRKQALADHLASK